VKRCKEPEPGKKVLAFSGSPKMNTFSQGIFTLSKMKIVSAARSFVQNSETPDGSSRR